MARKIRLHSPYAPIPLAEILKKEMKRKWTKEEKKSGRVVGSGTEEKFSLRVARKNIRNDFSTRFEGELTADRGGTLISGRMGRMRSVGCFMFFWLGFVGFFLFMGLIILGSDDAPLSFKIPFIGIPALMLLFGIALMKFGGRNGEKDEERILAFLRDKVKAREAPSSRVHLQ